MTHLNGGVDVGVVVAAVVPYHVSKEGTSNGVARL